MTLPSDHHGPLRIGTWNVEYARGEDKNRQRLQILNEQNADIWILTETHDDLDLSETHKVANAEPQHFSPDGARWVCIWSKLPIQRRIETGDPLRTVCIAVQHEGVEVIVYGTVLPWHADRGPNPDAPAKNWQEFKRVVPLQAAEWSQIRSNNPNAALVVGGDLNQSLGGPHYYGTKECTALLRNELAASNLRVHSEFEAFEPGTLQHPPIDHIATTNRLLPQTTTAWEGQGLSDHSGVMVELEM